MLRYKSHLLYFLLFFTIFYIESLSIAGIKIAIAWKLILIAFIIAYIVFDKGKALKPFIFWGYLYSLKNFVTTSSFIYFMSSLAEVIKCTFIPLMSHFFLLVQKNRGIDLYLVLRALAIYTIFSTVPFLLGIIQPLAKGYDLSLFGIDAYGFVGIFQIAHAAAITMAFSILILLFVFLKSNNKREKLFYAGLIVIALWVEIQTYARIGLAVLIVASAYLLLYKKRFTFYLKLMIPAVILSAAAYTYYLNSPVLQMRIQGTNKYFKQNNEKADIGSGRFDFYAAAVNNWSNGDFSVIIIGLGEEPAKDLMLEAVGLRIYAHNAFLDALQFNGLLGVLFFALFLGFMVVYIGRRRHSEYYQLTVTLFIGYLVSMLFQGEHLFLPDTMLALSLAMLNTKRPDESS